MAITVTDPVGFPISMGDRWLTIRSIALDNSYPAGGEALSLAELGFSQNPDIVRARSQSGYQFEYDMTAKKLKVLAPVKRFTSASTDIASIASEAQLNQAFVVTGVGATDVAIAAVPPAALEKLVVQRVAVTGANEITARLLNPTGSAVDAAAATWDFLVMAANGGGLEVPAATDLSALTAVVVESVGKYRA